MAPLIFRDPPGIDGGAGDDMTASSRTLAGAQPEAGPSVRRLFNRLAAIVLFAVAALAAAAPAQAQQCDLAYGPNFTAGGKTIPTLRVQLSGGAQTVFTAANDGTAAGSANNPNYACGSPQNAGANTNARFRKSDGTYKVLTTSSGWIVRFGNGSRLSRSGNNFIFTPGSTAGDLLLNGAVTLEEAGTLTNLADGEAGELSFYSGLQTDAAATTAGGRPVISITVTIQAPPAISSATPASGPAGGGNSVTITGTGFSASGNAVTFGGAAAAVTAQSATSITVTAPSHAPGAVAVVVTTAAADGQQTATLANGYTYVAAPAVTSLAPIAGPTSGGNVVVLTGINFTGANAVLFGGVAATAFTVNSATQITATAPGAAAGAVNVTVTTAGGTSATGAGNQYTFVSAPAVSSISPAAGPATGGTSVVITGTNLTGATTVAFGGTAATAFTVNSATQITATSPAGSGTVDVRVTTAGGTSAPVAADQYAYVAAPTVTALSPTSGTSTGGTSVVITGANLSGATAVTFGAAAAGAFTVNSPTQITATAPAGTGTVDVRVTTPGGTSATGAADQFTYVVLSAPTVTTQPVGQTVAVGATATFTAAASGSPAPTVQWQVSVDGGATFADVSGATSPAYTTPATTAADNGRRYRAVFTNSQGTATTAAATLTVVQAPTANGQSVTAAYQTAVAITLTATDPNSPPRSLNYTVTSAPGHGSLSGTAPNLTYTPAAGYSGPDSFAFTATNGVATSAAATVAITVNGPVASVAGVSPAQGTVAGGTTVTITGTNFTGATAVTFAGSPAQSFTVDGPGQITAVTPTGNAGAATVVVANAAGASTANGTFTYVTPPTANGQSVNVAFQTATAITLTGTNAASYTVQTGPAHGTLSGTAPNLTYTPAAGYAGPDSFTFATANGAGPSAPATVSITVGKGGQTIGFTSAAPGAAQVNGPAYAVAATASSGLPVTFTIDPSANGVCTISGSTVSFTGAGTCTIDADQPGNGSYNAAPRAQQSFAVAGPTITLAPATLPNAQSGTAYSQAVAASGGTAPYAYSVTAGALPSGLALSGGGTISGTPTAGGTFSFTVRATDSSTTAGAPFTGVRSYTLTVDAAAVAVAPPTLPGATAGQPYSQTLTASGGNAPYAYAVTAGVLPAGLTLSAGGVLSGTPTAGGTFNFTVRATDSSTGTGPYSGTRAYALVVALPTITVAPATLPGPTVGAAYSQTLTASGGTAPYGFAVTSGALPAGLSLSTGGALSGTPTAGGTFTFTVTATDANGFAGSRAYTSTVAAPNVTVAPASLPAGQSGTAYGQTLAASGGTAPYSYAVTAGALPSGLTLSTGGTLSGTPAASGTFTFTVTATDASTGSGPYAGSRSYTLTVAAPTLTLAPAALPDVAAGAAYSATLSASGGTAPYAYAITAGAPPAGLTLSAAGTLSGTPTAGGTFTFTVTATDATPAGNGGPYAVSRSYALTVTAGAVTIAPASLPAGTFGTAYSQNLTAAGGTAPYSFAVASGALPTGLALSPAGTLSGTPTASGSFAFSVSATDSSTGSGPYAGVRSYTLSIAAPTLALAPATLNDATVGAAYGATLTASGGTAPYAFSVTGGALPAGVALSASGALSGTPTAGGTFNFTVTATDSTGAGSGGPFSASRGYTLTVVQATIAVTPASLPAGTAGAAYGQSLTAGGGTAPYAFAVTSGALPTGLTLSMAGVLSGTPTASGTFTFSVTATDASTGTGPYAGTRSYTLTIGAATVAVSPASLAGGQSGTPYSQTLAVSGGVAPYSFTITNGALPAGLTLSTAGVLSGTPAASGSFAFTVTATDSTGGTGPASGSRAYTLAVAAPTLALNPATLGGATAGSAYGQTLTASGGTGPYGYAVTAGALPDGVTLSNGGALSGTPTAGGTFTFTVTATDSTAPANGGPYSVGRAYTLTVASAAVAIAPATLPAGQSGAAYAQTLAASGGTAPYTYSVTAGALPAGLTLSSGGALSGTPTQSGSFTFSVTATDSSTGSGPYAGIRSYTLSISAPTLALAPATLPGATVGAAYGQTLAASGGTAPYRYAVTAGALPAGVSLAADGTLAGTPTAGGTSDFTVTATDATPARNGGPYSVSQNYSLAVAAATVNVAPASLQPGQSGAAYSQTLGASGGTAPYSYAVTSGALPAGLTLSTGGVLSGTPTASGSFGFSVAATDASTGTGPYVGTRAYTLSIAAPALILPPATLNGATVGSAFSQAITASGGTGPYAYAITGGALPAGVTLSSGGVLSGTPTSGGSFGFTITATDGTTPANGGPYSVSRGYTLAVAGATVTVAPATLPAGQSGAAYGQTLTASGGTAPYSFAVASGAFPAGVTLSTAGTLSGTPTQSGSFTFVVTATDASNGSGPYAGTRSYVLTIAAPALSLAPANLPDATVASAYGQAITASGGTAPYAYAVTAGALPTGVTLSPGGLLSGTPTASGSFAFTVTATDGTAAANGGPYSTSRAYTLRVILPPPPVAQDAQPRTVAGNATSSGGQALSVDLSAQVTGSYTDIQVSTPPRNGTVTVVQAGGRFTATYVPAAGFGGADGFGFVAIGVGGRSNEARVPITVQGAVPVAPALRASTMSGNPVLVDLTATALGGPFTAARVVGSSPADAVATELVEGGTAGARTYQLRITPGGRFSGTATVQYTLSNAFGASAPATITLTVAARPDPSRDAAVTGIVTAQAESARRFAAAQTDNFLRRTEQLHGGGDGARYRGGLSIRGGNGSFGDYRPDASASDLMGLKLENARAVMGAERSRGLYRDVEGSPLGGMPSLHAVREGRAIAGATPGDDAQGVDGAAGAGPGGRSTGSVALWSGGAVTIGSRDATTGRDRLSISSGGLSAGADVKLGSGLVLGAGGGYGGDRTRIGRGSTTRVDGESWVGALYGSFAPTGGAFVDGVVGIGGLRFDTQRTVAANGALAIGGRDGSMVFGALSAGFDRTSDRFALSAYGRFNYLSADLDAYRETGAGLYDLAFASRELESYTGTLGIRAGVALGRITPRGRFEWRHEFSDSGVQQLDYADLTGYTYGIRGYDWLRDAFSLEVGFGYQVGGWQLGIDVSGQAGANARAATGKLSVSKRF